MTDRGHIARAGALGVIANRSLVRDVVHMLLRDQHQPAYIRYDRGTRKLCVSSTQPLHGVWRRVGPYNIANITILTLAQEVEFIARECREAARA